MQSWVDVVGWLQNLRWHTHLKMVTHPSTNRAQRRVTSFMRWTTLPLHQTTNHLRPPWCCGQNVPKPTHWLMSSQCDKCYYYYNHFTALWTLSETTRVSQYQKKHSPTYTYRGHQSSLLCFVHLLQSTASSWFNLCAWQSFSTISLQEFSSCFLDLAASTSYSIHLFAKSLSSLRSTCPYQCNLPCCRTEIHPVTFWPHSWFMTIHQ